MQGFKRRNRGTRTLRFQFPFLGKPEGSIDRFVGLSDPDKVEMLVVDLLSR